MRAAATPGTRVDWNGTTYEVVLTALETRDKLGIFEASGAQGDGPPRHIHNASDEVFILISGRIRFWLAGSISERGPGEIFHVPAGTEHSFVVLAPDGARWFAVLSPGGLESFFPDVAARGLEIPRDLPAIKALAADYDMTITGPPLGL